jgi:DNA mismatch repair ATPase MutS
VYTRISDVIGQFDALLSLAVYARTCEHDMCMPVIEHSGKQVCICACRFATGCAQAILELDDSVHPCLVSTIGAQQLIANSVQLDNGVLVLTGPNMGGKSTLMRQVALLCVLAQCVRTCASCAPISLGTG